MSEIQLKDIELLISDIKKNSSDLLEKMNTQQDEVRKHGGTLTQTGEQVGKLEKDYDKLQKDLSDVMQEMKTLQAEGKRLPYGSQEEIKTAGQLFVESDAFKNAMAQGLSSTNPVDVKTFFPTESKATIDSTVGAVLRPITRPFGLAPLYNQPVLTVRDIMNVAPISTASLEYIREASFTNSAAMQVEGAVKAESALTFTNKTAQVRTMAHFIPATRQILDDTTMLRNHIDTRLIQGLKIVEESQILYGSGTGVNLEGLMVVAGTQDAGTMPATGVTMIDFLRTQLTKTALTGLGTTGIVLHPTNWEKIETSKGTDGHYIFMSVNDGGVPRLFRVPVIESPAMAVNDFLLGAFGLGAQILDRETANVRVAEQHADFFTRNMVAILAEERLALPIYRPEAFVKGKFA